MEKKRSLQRKDIMIILYQVEIFEEKKVPYKLSELFTEYANDSTYIIETVQGILKNKEYIDKKANKFLNNWNLNRLGKTDGAIIRMGIYEILFTETPPPVCIDEAIKLAKTFSDPKMFGMVNGVLDHVYHEKEK